MRTASITALAALPFVLDAACSVNAFCDHLWEMTTVCCRWSCTLCRAFVIHFLASSGAAGSVIGSSSQPCQDSRFHDSPPPPTEGAAAAHSRMGQDGETCKGLEQKRLAGRWGRVLGATTTACRRGQPRGRRASLIFILLSFPRCILYRLAAALRLPLSVCASQRCT